MAKAKQDKQREQRIQQEIVVDAQLRFPFRAKCIAQRAISPLRKGQEVQVVGLAPAQEM